MGAQHNNCLVCDTKGVIYQGRTEGMNQWKSAHAATTQARSLKEAMVGADVFLGCRFPRGSDPGSGIISIEN
jgi:malate dehydrogenase (oxaloacetate-decarboxylating)(NADP+)